MKHTSVLPKHRSKVYVQWVTHAPIPPVKLSAHQKEATVRLDQLKKWAALLVSTALTQHSKLPALLGITARLKALSEHRVRVDRIAWVRPRRRNVILVATVLSLVRSKYRVHWEATVLIHLGSKCVSL